MFFLVASSVTTYSQLNAVVIFLVLIHKNSSVQPLGNPKNHTGQRPVIALNNYSEQKALDLQLTGCEFNSRPRRCRVTTLGKLFTPTCLSRSQWFSHGMIPWLNHCDLLRHVGVNNLPKVVIGMIDCGVRGRGQLCLARQPLRCTALGTGYTPFLQCLGQLSLQPSVGR